MCFSFTNLTYSDQFCKRRKKRKEKKNEEGEDVNDLLMARKR